MEIEHRPGRKHGNADALSRIPCTQCGFDSNWETNDSKPLARVLHSSTEVEDNKNWLVSASLRESQDESKDIQLVRKWVNLGKRPSYLMFRSMGT